MFTPWLLSALARAFIAGDPNPDAVVERCTRLLGKPWRWLKPLAVRYHETIAPESSPNPPLREVLRFLQSDKGFRSAAKHHRKALELAQPIPDPPEMHPVPAAKNWPLPALTTGPELAHWLDLSLGELEWFADLAAMGYRNKNPRLRHYHYRVLPKDATNVRLIEAPKERLKKLQQRILSGILDQVPMHDSVHGFRKGRSIQTFCQPHVNQLIVLKMDLRDFFPSIGRARIQALFRTFGYPEPVADVLGGLCTNATPRDIWHNVAWETQMLYCQPHLPQGAPSSPALANLCAYRLDCRLSALAKTCSASYTRYADDLAFSGKQEFAKCAERFSIQAAAIAAEEGFVVHHRKTRLMRRSVRQHIAGLVINERPNIRRTDFDELKAILTNCVRSGPEAQNRGPHASFRLHLQGRVAFVKSINLNKGTKLEQLFERISWG
jgi:RNA-directed DNA polymerase